MLYSLQFRINGQLADRMLTVIGLAEHSCNTRAAQAATDECQWRVMVLLQHLHQAQLGILSASQMHHLCRTGTMIWGEFEQRIIAQGAAVIVLVISGFCCFSSGVSVEFLSTSLPSKCRLFQVHTLFVVRISMGSSQL